MARIKNGGWVYCCGACNLPFLLSGFVPNAETLERSGWKFCPFCGEPIEYFNNNDLSRIDYEEWKKVYRGE